MADGDKKMCVDRQEGRDQVEQTATQADKTASASIKQVNYSRNCEVTWPDVLPIQLKDVVVYTPELQGEITTNARLSCRPKFTGILMCKERDKFLKQIPDNY